MKAYRTEKRVAGKGALHLDALPFREGALVEVIVLPREESHPRPDPLFLRGKVVEYVRPTEPVAQDDWEASR